MKISTIPISILFSGLISTLLLVVYKSFMYITSKMFTLDNLSDGRLFTLMLINIIILMPIIDKFNEDRSCK